MKLVQLLLCLLDTHSLDPVMKIHTCTHALHQLRMESGRAIVFGTEAVPEITKICPMTEAEASEVAALMFFVLDYGEDVLLLSANNYPEFLVRHVQWPGDAHVCFSKYFPALNEVVTQRASVGGP
mgnify:CR=1 FL=1